jgi:BMFP domain-containing protein YqiC
MGAPASGNRILDAVEELLSELPGRVRGSRNRLSAQALSALRALAEELSLVTRDEYEELELRVAQLEHRLKLLERPPAIEPGAAEPGSH